MVLPHMIPANPVAASPAATLIEQFKDARRLNPRRHVRRRTGQTTTESRASCERHRRAARGPFRAAHIRARTRHAARSTGPAVGPVRGGDLSRARSGAGAADADARIADRAGSQAAHDRAARGAERHDGVEARRAPVADGRRHLRDPLGRHPARGRHDARRSDAARRRPGRGARLRSGVRDQRARVQHHDGQQDARHDRRPHRVLAALLRRVLGGPGRRARRHRPHRSHPRSRRIDLGRERRERRDQHHHEAGGGYARRTRRGWRRAADGREGHGAVRRTPGLERVVSRVRPVPRRRREHVCDGRLR